MEGLNAKGDVSAPVVGPRKSNSPLRKFGALIDRGLTSGFGKIGAFVARNPYKVIAITTIAALLMGAGMARIKVEQDSEKLYTPQHNDAFTDREFVQSLYGYDPLSVNIYAGSQSPLSTNVITREFLVEYYSLMKQITLVQGVLKGNNYSFSDAKVCYRPGGTGTLCDVVSVLDYWQYNLTLIETDPDLLGTVSNTSAVDMLGRPLSQKRVMGDLKFTFDGKVASAGAVQFVALVQNNKDGPGSSKVDKVTESWEKALQVAVEDFDEKSSIMQLFVLSDYNQNHTADKAITNDISLLIIGYILLVFYGMLVLAKPHSIESRSLMAVANVLSILLAVLATYGIGILVGVKFSLVVQVLALLLLGLGTDDMLVTMAAHDETGREMPEASIEDRVRATVSRARRGVIVASLTNFVALVTGTSSSLPALRDFMTFAAIGVVMVLIFQSTFYVACITLDLRRQRNRKFDLLPCVSSKAGPADGCCGRSYDPTQSSISQRLIGEALPKLALHPVGKVIVLAVTVFLAVGGVIGAIRVKQNFSIDWFIPSGTYVSDALQYRNEHFQVSAKGVEPFSVYTKNPNMQIDYFTRQDELLALATKLQANPYVNEAIAIQAWYPSYIAWLATSAHSSSLTFKGRPQTSVDFYTFLNEFLASSDGDRFKRDIIVSNNSATPGIESSRYTAYFRPLKDSVLQVNAMRSVRKSAKSAAPTLQAIAYTDSFLFYEGFAVIAKDTVQEVAIAGSVVFLIVLVLVADLVVAVLVGCMVALVDLELVAFLYWADLSFNSVTSINLLLAVGIAVDYSTFVAFSFMTRTGTRQERAHKALSHFGVAVFNGGFTMFLAVLPVAAASSYIFRTFFKMFSMIVALGLWHGLFTLPVLLSFIGSNPMDSAYTANQERIPVSAEVAAEPDNKGLEMQGAERGDAPLAADMQR